MEQWVSRSSPGQQLLLAIGMAVVGVAVMFGTRDFASQGDNATAGFGLGVLIAIIGIAGVFYSGRQTVTVDPRLRIITIADSYLVASKKRVIHFGEITEVGIGYLGKKSSGVTMYYLVLHLHDGQEYPLFAPGRFYPGASDRTVVEGWRTRLDGCLTQTSR